MGLSNNITAILNLIALLCSIPIIASGLWLASKADNECVHLFRWPLLVLGFLLMLISLIGFLGAYCYKEGLLGVYLCCMAILITLLLVLLIFAFVVTRPDGSYWLPSHPAYKEYRLQGFSSWLRAHLTTDDYWPNIRNCLTHTNICAKLNHIPTPDQYYFLPHISPLQSGCCKPPTACGYRYVSPTNWINPANPTADPDCSLWTSDPTTLCYNCTSCRAGLLGSLTTEWRKLNIILIITVVVLIFVYVIACSAFRNAQTEDLFRKYKEGWA